MSDAMQEAAFNERCYQLREQLKELTSKVRGLKAHSSCFEAGLLPKGGDRGEMIANIMLAYRHLEDAAMRLGKAVQAYDGGISVYPR